MKEFKERRIWYFSCSKCGKNHRQSHRKKNAKIQLCLKCRKNEVPENQLSIFNENKII